MIQQKNIALEALTFSLLFIASITVDFAFADGMPIFPVFIASSTAIGLIYILGYLIRKYLTSYLKSTVFIFLFLLMLIISPFILEFSRRLLTQNGLPLEILIILAFRNLCFGVNSIHSDLNLLKISAISSLFLLLFGISTADHFLIIYLVGLYSAVGSLWLLINYLNRINFGNNSSNFSFTEKVLFKKNSSSIFIMVALIIFIFCGLGLFSISPKTRSFVLGEWFSTSGGTSEYSQFSRGGVNNGDDQIKGDNPNGTGMVDSDTFMDSPLPTLYDLINELYGEPFKPKDRERAIALDSNTKTLEPKKTAKDNLRPNKDFSTSRRQPNRTKEIQERLARAVIELEGRTPLHIRLRAYDTFDRITWSEEQKSNKSYKLIEKEAESNWMKVVNFNSKFKKSEPEIFKLKVCKDIGSLVPTSPMLSRFRVGKVNQPDFFTWYQDGILSFKDRGTPTGTIVESESTFIKPELMEKVSFTEVHTLNVNKKHQVNIALKITELAKEIVQDISPGWFQIQTVVRYVKTNFELDANATVPDSVDDSVSYFLFEKKKGPDYQFASSLTILLRSLDYQTRLVNGYYAKPEHYDYISKHTPINNEDLHFWTEIQLSNGEWVLLEPTPGYEVEKPLLDLMENLNLCFILAIGWVKSNLIFLTLIIFCFLIILKVRIKFIDFIATLIFYNFLLKKPRESLIYFKWLVELRARLIGKQKPSYQTFSAWLNNFKINKNLDQNNIQCLKRMIDWASYGYSTNDRWDFERIKDVLKNSCSIYTLKEFQKINSHNKKIKEVS